jgi:hypothetical protein
MNKKEKVKRKKLKLRSGARGEKRREEYTTID